MADTTNLESTTPSMSATALSHELDTYARALPSLRAANGKFVLIRDAEVVKVYDTYGDALQAGYEKFGVDTPFLVKQIQQVERIQQFSRDIGGKCHT
jgi:hypothetical protein